VARSLLLSGGVVSDRWVLEGEWSGYVARQRRIVHREVVRGRRVDRLRNLHAIQYTDGTLLTLSLRPARHREKVETINAYGSLIHEAEMLNKNFVLVSELRS
jgi:hypothetical protein